MDVPNGFSPTFHNRLWPACGSIPRRCLFIALLALGTLLPWWSSSYADFHLRVPEEGEEVLGYIKGDRAIIQAQLEIAVTHLKHSLAYIDGAPDLPAIQKAAHLAHLSYRMIRFATHGIMLLGDTRSGRFRNPLFTLLIDALDKSRVHITHASLLLAATGKWQENNPDEIGAALERLQEALTLAEEAQLLL